MLSLFIVVLAPFIGPIQSRQRGKHKCLFYYLQYTYIQTKSTKKMSFICIRMSERPDIVFE